MPGQARTRVVVRRTSSSSSGIASSTGSKAPRRSARRSQTSSPAAGTTLNASPERRIVGTAVRRSGPSAAEAAATRWAAVASASRALRPRCGAEPECAGRPCACTRSVPAALRFTITASSPGRRALAGLEAEAGVEAGEALGVAEGDRAPLLVVHQQHRGLGVQLGPPGQLAHDPQRQRHAALHVHRPRAAQAVALALERAVLAVGHDRVEMAEQQQPRLALPAQPPDQVRGVPLGGAGRALDLGLRRQKGGTERNRLVGPRARRPTAWRRRRAPPARARP